MATHGLTNMYNDKLSKLQNKQNANTIAEYINTLRHENASFSDHYRMSIIKVLNRLSNFCENKNFRSMNRTDDILPFLNSYRKSDAVDPLHKLKGTYNLYLEIIAKFFKWLYYPDHDVRSRPKPKLVQNIASQKRNEVSCYKPTG